MLVGPLNTSYCLYFYILSVGNLCACLLLFGVCILNVNIVKKATSVCFLWILFFMMYFQNRLLYNMCKKETTTEFFLSNSSQFDQKKKGLRDLGVRNNHDNNLYDMLSVVIDVTQAAKKPEMVDYIDRYVAEVASRKRDKPTGYKLRDGGLSQNDLEQFENALKNAFDDVSDKRELYNRIRSEGGLLRSMVAAEREAVIAKENAEALELANSKFTAVNANVTKNTTQLNTANTGIASIGDTQKANDVMINSMLKYVDDNGKIWNAQSATMLANTQNMMTSLSKIDTHLDPTKYRQ